MRDGNSSEVEDKDVEHEEQQARPTLLLTMIEVRKICSAALA